jgi:hypothetical protein
MQKFNAKRTVNAHIVYTLNNKQFTIKVNILTAKKQCKKLQALNAVINCVTFKYTTCKNAVQCYKCTKTIINALVSSNVAMCNNNAFKRNINILLHNNFYINTRTVTANSNTLFKTVTQILCKCVNINMRNIVFANVNVQALQQYLNAITVHAQLNNSTI